jgi:hypothetical protein
MSNPIANELNLSGTCPNGDPHTWVYSRGTPMPVQGHRIHRVDNYVCSECGEIRKHIFTTDET